MNSNVFIFLLFCAVIATSVLIQALITSKSNDTRYILNLFPHVISSTFISIFIVLFYISLTQNHPNRGVWILLVCAVLMYFVDWGESLLFTVQITFIEVIVQVAMIVIFGIAVFFIERHHYHKLEDAQDLKDIEDRMKRGKGAGDIAFFKDQSAARMHADEMFIPTPARRLKVSGTYEPVDETYSHVSDGDIRVAALKGFLKLGGKLH